MSDFVHIVCLDNPFPPDYGGAIDMYYKIVALHRMGRKVILHYFNYKPGNHQEDLQKYCHQMYSYSRTTFRKGLLSRLPYIVRSRINNELIARLNLDTFPILLEGIHCSGILPYLKKDRKIVLRLHNNESSYYRSLSLSKVSVIKKLYYRLESRLLEQYQKNLPKHITLACISTYDADTFRREYNFSSVCFIPCFIPWQKILPIAGKGTFCLYHGNIAIPENEAVAIWLIEKVFSKLEISLIIAGKGMSQALRKSASIHSNVQLIANPSANELNDLIRNAQINILPALNNTGVKLKLLHALIEGRFCVTNFRGVVGSAIGPELPIVVWNTEDDVIQEISELFSKEFTEKYYRERQGILKVYNNHKNARELSALL